MTILGYPVDIYLYGTQMTVASWTSIFVVTIYFNMLHIYIAQLMNGIMGMGTKSYANLFIYFNC